MRRFSITFVLTFLVIFFVVLLAGTNGLSQGTPSNLPATSAALSPTSTVIAGSSASAESSVTAYPTIDYGYDMTPDGPDLEPYANPDGTPGVPHYPGAVLTRQSCIRVTPGGCFREYMTNDEEESKAAAFYNEALPKRGWEYLGKSVPEDNLITQNYYYSWKNPSDSGPGRVSLIVLFERRSRGTYIGVEITAWPDAKNPPLHPQAKEVQVEWGKDPTEGFLRRTVSYIVNLSNSEAIDYYKKVMKQQGWSLNLHDSTDRKLAYFYTPVGPEGSSGARIEITSASVDSGKGTANTSVQITTSSEDFTPEDAQEGK